MIQGQVVPFRRPVVVIFERFNPDDMSALFRAHKMSDTYRFSMSGDELLEGSIEHEDGRVTLIDEFSRPQQEQMFRFAKEAAAVLAEQLSTWENLTPQERVSLLIHWSDEVITSLERAIVTAVGEGPRRYAREIAGMYSDIEYQEIYLEALKTVRSLF